MSPEPLTLAAAEQAGNVMVEDVHRCSQRNGGQVLALRRTFALNLLRCNGFRSIRAGLRAVAHDIRRMLDWVGISLAETS
ncbi:MAG: hypothetical protein RLZZ117_2913 [Cyanobacteriota bacterium]|jgi:hypothetical protein